MKLNPINEFAKIIPASSGQQVLFFLDYCTQDDYAAEEGNKGREAAIHCMATFEEMQVDVKINFGKKIAAIQAFNRLDTAFADKVLKQATGGLLGK